MTIIAILLAAALALPKTDATVGVAAIDLDTGSTVSVRGDEPFPMASVFKFPLAIAVLQKVDAGQLRLDRAYTIQPGEFSPGWSPIRERANGKPVTLALRDLVVAAVSDSDNTAGDYLLNLITPKAIRFEGIVVDRTEGSMIRSRKFDAGNHATPLAMTALLGRFYRKTEGLKPASHDFLWRAMTDSKNPARIGRLLPKGSSVAHKTGTMPAIANDAGVITSPDGKHHIAIAIFTKGGKAADATRDQLVAEIAKSVYDRFTAPRRLHR